MEETKIYDLITNSAKKKFDYELFVKNFSALTVIDSSNVDIAENIFDFKKGWENRDKDQEKTLRAIDEAFREISKDNEEETSDAKRNARSLASAATGLLRRDASFKAAFVGYAMTTSNVALSYCERSMAQYKK